MSLPLPRWLRNLPPENRPFARRRFLMRIAMLYASEEGHAIAMATRIGLAPKSLSAYTRPGTTKNITAEMARQIEEITHGVVPASKLRV